MNPKNLAMIVYAQRKRRDIMPEGKKDTSGRWYPTTREDAEGDEEQAHLLVDAELVPDRRHLPEHAAHGTSLS